MGGAFTNFRNQRVKVLDARVHESVSDNIANNSFAIGAVTEVRKDGIMVRTADGYLLVVHVQAESKKPMLARDWANGLRVAVGDQFEFLSSSTHKDAT